MKRCCHRVRNNCAIFVNDQGETNSVFALKTIVIQKIKKLSNNYCLMLLPITQSFIIQTNTLIKKA